MPRRLARLAPAALLLSAATATAAHAQFGPGRGGRGGDRPSPDSAAGRLARDPSTINTVDVILEKRADLGLTGEQVARVNVAKGRRDAAVDTLRTQAEALRPPTDPNAWTTMSDSEKVAMRDRIRARAATLRAQRDAEARAREEALAALTPDQAARAVQMEENMRRAAFAAQRFGGGSWRAVASDVATEVPCLQLSSEHAHRRLGWRPRLTIEQAVVWAIDGYRAMLQQQDAHWLIEQIHAYEALPAARPFCDQVPLPRAEPAHAYA